MKAGKISIAVNKRSILRQLSSRRKEAAIIPSLYENCGGIDVRTSGEVIFSDVSLYGNEKELGAFAVVQAVNHLWAKGVAPVGIDVSILLPPASEEAELKELAGCMEQSCDQMNLDILSIQAEVTEAVNLPVVSVTALGTAEANERRSRTAAGPGQDIILTKWAGMEGTIRVLKEKRAELSERFVQAFLQRIDDFEKELPVFREAQIARQHGASAVRQVTSGGIMAALWAVSEEAGAGLEIEMERISLKQETVEICEHFRLNPYQLTSAGCLLIVTDDGKKLAKKLEAEGIAAGSLGTLTGNNDKLILKGCEKRYLDRPAPDELIKIYKLKAGKDHDKHCIV